MDRKVKGYTTMEILIVIAIVSILSGFFLFPMLVQVARERLRAGMNQFASDLNQAKLRSISTGSMWGIRVCRDNRQYKVFIDNDANCRDVDTNCNNVDARMVCAARPNIECDNNPCPPDAGPCVQMERLITFPVGVTPQNDFYVVFDRRGYALNFNCGFAAGTLRLRNFFGEERRIVLDRLGRVRYE